MAKKVAEAPVLTPRQQALQTAQAVVQLEAQKAELDAQIKEYKASLVEYVAATGEKDLGALCAEQRQGKPKFDFGDITPKQKKFVLEALQAALPDFMETSTELNVEKVYFAMSGNLTVQNALRANNVSVIQEATWAFKKVGNEAA